LDKFFNFTNYNIIINKNIFFNYLSFYPLPTKLITKYYNNVINIEHNIYSLINGNYNKLLYADRILPYITKSPIPFVLPIINNNNNIELIDSNVYYYELTLLENMLEPWEKQNIIIGYGPINTPIDSCLGWINDTFGLHTNDGTYYYNQIIFKKILNQLKEGDTIGAGIIYLEKNKYNPFFTYNGTLLSSLEDIYINCEILPIIKFNYPNKIKLNFCQEKFIFNIKNIINCNKIISENNSFINSNHSINKISTDTIIHNKINYNNTYTNFPFFDNNDNVQISNIILSLTN
jgi:hypothetical protein